jgi:hypothetical protein
LSLEEERLDQCDGSSAKEMLMFVLDLEEKKRIACSWCWWNKINRSQHPDKV